MKIVLDTYHVGTDPALVSRIAEIRDRVAILIGECFSVWEFAAAVESMTAGHAVKTQLRFS